MLQYFIPFDWRHRTPKFQFARDHGYGVEIDVFAGGPGVDDPHVRSEYERRLTTKLRCFEGPVSMHGAFMDLAVHSGDSLIARCSRERIQADLDLASRLGCRKVVFHTGFNQLVPTSTYRERFLDRHEDFWKRVGTMYPELTICLENQWEPDPAILLDIMRRVDLPNVRVCLDVAHAHAYSTIPAVTWLHQLASYIAHMHWNDNCGTTDSHLPIGAGTIDWASLLDRTARLRRTTSVVLELSSLQEIQRSLKFLEGMGVGHTIPITMTVPMGADRNRGTRTQNRGATNRASRTFDIA